MFWQCNGCLAGVCLARKVSVWPALQAVFVLTGRQNGLHNDGSVCSTKMRVVGSAGLCSFFHLDVATMGSGGLWSATV